MTGYVYILEDDNHQHYIGSTANLPQRYKRHLSGFVYTSYRMKNPKMVFCQQYPSIKEAKKIELRLKKLKRKDYIEKIINDGFIKMK